MVTFIHNSLIAFLKSETRSRLPGSDPATDEREFHSILADRSVGRSCLDPVGRARVVHLMRAERHSDVPAQLSSDWLRSAVHGFLPYDHIRPILLAGYAATSAMGNWDHTLRLLLLSHELDQRTSGLSQSGLLMPCWISMIPCWRFLRFAPKVDCWSMTNTPSDLLALCGGTHTSGIAQI